jgi:hypothetical protein
VIDSIIAGVSAFATGASVLAGTIDAIIVGVSAFAIAAGAFAMVVACSGALDEVLVLKVAPGSGRAVEAVAVVAGSGTVSASTLGGGAGTQGSVACRFEMRANSSSVVRMATVGALRLACSTSTVGVPGVGRVGRLRMNSGSSDLGC